MLALAVLFCKEVGRFLPTSCAPEFNVVFFKFWKGWAKTHRPFWSYMWCGHLTLFVLPVSHIICSH